MFARSLSAARTLVLLWLAAAISGCLLTSIRSIAAAEVAADGSSGKVLRTAPIRVLFLGDRGHHQPAKFYEVLRESLASRDIELTYTERLSSLDLVTLSWYDVLLVYANHPRIEPHQEQALLDFVAQGGGFVPVHCASYCFLNSDRYVQLVGGQFKSHGTGVFRPRIVRPDHPAMAGVEEFEAWDETYVHTRLNPDRVVLMERVDAEHREPWTWVRQYGKGRVFYTASGHDNRVWSNPGFQRLIDRGIRWAAGDHRKALPQIAMEPFAYTEARIPFYPPGERRPGDGQWNQMQLPLPAQESVKHVRVPPGMEAKLFAAEPDIRKPICMTWDDRGRLWVAETYDYPNDLQPSGQGRDRITICEDTDGDGRADRFTLFADKLSIPTSLCVTSDGVIVSQAPHFLLLRDNDGDDRADERRVLLTGWNTYDTHAGPSNLRWGPDNWIWGTVGYAGFRGQVGGQQLQFRQGIFRMRPDGSQLEHLASTTNNTWGLGFSEEGLPFASTANNCPSVFLPIANRYYETVPGLSRGALQSIAETHAFHPITDKVRQVDAHGRYTAGAGHAMYTARQYPRWYWNRVAFVNGPTGHLTGQYVLERVGAGVVARDAPPLLASDDEWTAPIVAEVGPDGNVWIIDWYNYIVQHNPTPRGYETGKGNAYRSELRDKRHGRIYRVVATDRSPRSELTLSEADSQQLVAALDDTNQLWRMHAQRRLVQENRLDALPALVARLGQPRPDAIGVDAGAMHALWTLDGLGVVSGQVLQRVYACLQHPSWGVRRAALDVLPSLPVATRQILDNRLLQDEDAQVRLHALLALARMPREDAAGMALFAFLQDEQNAADPILVDGATIAAARHDAGFLQAVIAEHKRRHPQTLPEDERGDDRRADDQVANLLPNGLLEAGQDGKPVGWQPRTYSGQGGRHGWVREGRGGSYCLKISADSPVDTSWFAPAKVKPHTKYRLTAWVRTRQVQNVANGRGAMLNVHELQSDASYRTSALKGTAPWTQLSTIFDSQGRQELTINCLFGGWGRSIGTAWYDDIRLEPVSESTELASGMSEPVDRALRLVAANYARRGAADSVMTILRSLQGASSSLARGMLEGLIGGWPEDRPVNLSADDVQALHRLAKWMAPEARDALIVLVDRWGQPETLAPYRAETTGALASIVHDERGNAAARTDAAERLIRLDDSPGQVAAILEAIASPLASPELVRGLLEAVASSRRPETGGRLIEHYEQLTPASRPVALQVLLRRTDWTGQLLQAIADRRVDRADLSQPIWDQLSQHPNSDLADQARQLAGGAVLGDPDRQKVIAQVAAALPADASSERGAKIFQAKCGQCHRINGQGGQIGPDLAGIGKRRREDLLIEVLDPNRSVEGNYRRWTVVTTDGQVHSGLLSAESRTTIELLDAEGKRHVFPRDEIEELYSSRLSLMPVGLEQDLKPQDFSDLLEFLRVAGSKAE